MGWYQSPWFWLWVQSTDWRVRAPVWVRVVVVDPILEEWVGLALQNSGQKNPPERRASLESGTRQAEWDEGWIVYLAPGICGLC